MIIPKQTYEGLLQLKDLKDNYTESIKQGYEELEKRLISELQEQGWDTYTPVMLLGNTVIQLDYYDDYFIDMEDLEQLQPDEPILEELTDVLHDPIHKEIGITRPIKITVRNHATETMGNS